MKDSIPSRRQFPARGILLAGALPIVGIVTATAEEKEPEEEVSPAEDLMQEHGVLKRVLLIYGEGARRLEVGEDLPPEAIADSAKIIRNFIEDYHEKLADLEISFR